MTFIENPVYVLTVLALMVLLSLYAAKTKWGKPFGAALLVIVFTAVVANLKLIPSASNSIPLYDAIFNYLAPISIFFLLLGANLKSIKKAGIPMIGLFLIGSLATVLGILISWYLISPQNVLGDDGKILAGMLTGTYTGGSVNFNAVALAYDFQEKGILYAGAIAVDNVVTAIWVVITIAFPMFLRRFIKDKKLSTDIAQEKEVKANNMDLKSLGWLLFIGLSSFLISELVSKVLPSIPSIITLSTIGIILAQTSFVSKLKGGHTLGLYLVYLFLAVIGAYCEIGAVLALKEIGLTLLFFTSLAVLIHGLIIIVLGGSIFRDWDMLSIASQANVGGGTSAIALAETFNRKELILPAILVGTLGNALGTYLGFMVVSIL
ncbi:DUF819 domain-containing protein [Croceitalea rosinachiae]|uniref:DUF819 family protein n=1 Tax=Croceitalea rosinachiae TaxID=3075596 RepID=A0ABU3ADI1_9FLAO|nr:DUF819 family protein [Croceitalea sp. F388]MDT0608242.1 DUF819 family protein [Croceitalea sp. F388]